MSHGAASTCPGPTIDGRECHPRLRKTATPCRGCRARIRRAFVVDTPDRTFSPYPRPAQAVTGAHHTRNSTTRGGPTGPAQYALETPYRQATRPGNTCPVSPWAKSRSCYPFTLPLGAPSVLPRSRGLHPLGPLLPAQTPPKAAEFGWTRETWLSVCLVAVPTLTTAQPVQTARGSQGGDVEARSSPLSRCAPIPSKWTQSLRSSPLSLLWWLRWQLYSVRPEVRTRARQRRKTLRYKATGTEGCPPRPPDWWPW